MKCFTIVFCILVACLSATSAVAQPYLAVVLDRTGSMRFGVMPSGDTFCEDALGWAEVTVVGFFDANPGGSAAVWTFAANSVTNLTGGFVGESDALGALSGLSPTGCISLTPLADAMCEAVKDFPPGDPADRTLALATDGVENNSSGQCSGPSSAKGPPPPGNYIAGSWQDLAYSHIVGNGVANVAYWGFALRPQGDASVDVETGQLRGTSVPDSVFFQDLAESTGGTYTEKAGSSIPALSEWGLVVMTLLGLAIGTIIFARRRLRTSSTG